MNELPAVPLHVCADKAGQLGEGPDVVRVKALRQDTQAGAEDEGGLRRRGRELLLQFLQVEPGHLQCVLWDTVPNDERPGCRHNENGLHLFGASRG